MGNENNLVGIALILFGIVLIWYTKKYPTKENDPWLLNLRGYSGGIIAIIGGVLFLIGYFSKKIS